MRSRRHRSKAALGAVSAIASALTGFAVIMVFVMLISTLMVQMDISDTLLSVLTSAALCAGAFSGGIVAARRRRQNGLLMGLLCGLLMFGVIFVLSYVFAGAAGGMKGGGKLVMTLVSASLGGVIGVNTNGNVFHIK